VYFDSVDNSFTVTMIIIVDNNNSCRLDVIALRCFLQSQAAQGLVLAHREFWCPMCRQLANSVLPMLPDADGCSDPERLLPDTEAALVRHVADVLSASYPKQVASL